MTTKDVEEQMIPAERALKLIDRANDLQLARDAEEKTAYSLANLREALTELGVAQDIIEDVVIEKIVQKKARVEEITSAVNSLHLNIDQCVNNIASSMQAAYQSLGSLTFDRQFHPQKVPAIDGKDFPLEVSIKKTKNSLYVRVKTQNSYPHVNGPHRCDLYSALVIEKSPWFSPQYIEHRAAMNTRFLDCDKNFLTWELSTHKLEDTVRMVKVNSSKSARWSFVDHELDRFPTLLYSLLEQL